MKVTCNKNDLVDGIQTIQAGLSSRTTLPILMNFLLETEDSFLKLTATDLEIGVKHYVKAQIEGTGSIAVPAKKFSEMLHSFPEGQNVSLSIDSNGKLSLRCGRSYFLVSGSPKNEYPVFPTVNKEKTFSVLANPILDMISKTLFSTSLPEVNHVLSGVFWSADKGKLDMIATDGRRLAVSSQEALPKEASFQSIIPHKTLSEFLRLASLHKIDSDSAKKIKITITDNQIVFEFNQTTLLSRLVSGTFPNYKRVIPEKTDFSIMANTADLLTSTKRAALCVGDRGGTVSYSLNSEALKISAISPYSEYDDEIPIKYSGNKFDIAFNPAFMVEALKRIDSESVRMSFTTSSNPVRVEPEKGKDYFFIIMPMRVEAPV